MSRKQVLIVEDEAMIAMGMEDMVADEGHAVIGPAGSVRRALELIASNGQIDCALLDVNLRGELVYPVADALTERGIPFAFTSGYGEAGLDPRFAGKMVLPKPIDPHRLASFLASALPSR
jgi:CheY-like chemotaxis protein